MSASDKNGKDKPGTSKEDKEGIERVRKSAEAATEAFERKHGKKGTGNGKDRDK
jgi:hypothetical protein